ncbi:hypothetical protein [Campylobacter gastrosuis]|uniref:Uncharacterized protein n=1 Tax=Campylobacter gastrosuis TaxID=2974576 RepID=A0ABT7HSH6_9BACT|nr:hypothetical protein [Campylobacter gastrosuis]MDL0089876.1 hypothetical protein [Campylobacter gastrosuis]
MQDSDGNGAINAFVYFLLNNFSKEIFMKIFKTIIKSILYLIIFLCFFIGGLLLFLNHGKAGGKTIDIARKSIDEIKNILINKKYCGSYEDCTNKNFVLYEASFNDIYLNIYNNVDKNTIKEMCKTIKDIKIQYKNIDFYMSFFKYKKEEYYKKYKYENNTYNFINEKAFYKCKY